MRQPAPRFINGNRRAVDVTGAGDTTGTCVEAAVASTTGTGATGPGDSDVGTPDGAVADRVELVVVVVVSASCT